MTTPESFKALVRQIAGELELEAKEIHIRPMKRKWASCSSRGRLTFNSELLSRPLSKHVEVILHELLHQKYPNHGKMFRLMMRTYTEAYAKIEEGYTGGKVDKMDRSLENKVRTALPEEATNEEVARICKAIEHARSWCKDAFGILPTDMLALYFWGIRTPVEDTPERFVKSNNIQTLFFSIMDRELDLVRKETIERGHTPLQTYVAACKCLDAVIDCNDAFHEYIANYLSILNAKSADKNVDKGSLMIDIMAKAKAMAGVIVAMRADVEQKERRAT